MTSRPNKYQYIMFEKFVFQFLNDDKLLYFILNKFNVLSQIIQEKTKFEDCGLNKYVYDIDNTILLNVKINEREMGRLMSWTKSINQISLYNDNELREIHINNFIPKCFIKQHSEILNEYIKSGISTRSFSTIILPFVNKAAELRYADF